MNNLDEVFHISKLLDTYGTLLTKKQFQMMDMYYNFNLSFGEIAEELNITRSAVNDTLKKSLKALEKYESNLKILFKKDKILDICNEIDKKDTDKCVREEIEKIKEIM